MNIVQITSSSFSFQLQDPDNLRIVGTVPYATYLAALDAVNSLSADKANIESDLTLSGLGRETKRGPLFSRGWAALCNAYVAMARFEANVDARDAALIALPSLAPSASAIAVEDAECRQIYRSLPTEERLRIQSAMANDPAAGEIYLRTQVAILRSPFPFPDEVTDFFTRMWRQTQRTRNVGEALAIDNDRLALQWGLSGLAHLFGAMKLITGWQASTIARFVVADSTRIIAARLMGISDMEVATEEARNDPTHQTRRMA